MIRWIKAHREYMEFTRATQALRSRDFYIPMLSDAEGPALGITISKKVANAVARNRLKRRIRAWAREHSSALPTDCKMNIIARQGAAELSYSALSDQLSILERCEVFSQP